jgi:threonine/homoserine/homoserine lactone efflux protein
VLAFLGVSMIVIATPGPDTALTIRSALFRGRSAGVSTAAGVASGQAVWALCTAAGLAALLRESQPAFVALRIAGAAYLVYLGARALVDGFRGASHASHRGVGRSAYRQGLLSNLGNPKMAVFFVSLLPQFASPSFGSLLALGLVFCALTFVWLSAYAFVVARVGDVLRRSRVRRSLDAITGAVLVALGFRVAGERA